MATRVVVTLISLHDMGRCTVIVAKPSDSENKISQKYGDEREVEHIPYLCCVSGSANRLTKNSHIGNIDLAVISERRYY